jgi:hypothetical protein
VKRDQEPPGDYGYDLAHEEIGREQAPEGTTGHPTGDPTGEARASASRVGGTDERSADLGYDEAHDF